MMFFFSANGLQEPEVEICASMLDALNECIQVSMMKLRCISSSLNKYSCQIYCVEVK